MKRLKYLLGISVAMATLFTSCDTDNMGDLYQSQTLGVTFETASQSVSFPAHGYEGFDVEVVRAISAEAATINIASATLLDSKGDPLPLPNTILVPPSVSFAAGENISKFHVTVGDITPGMNYKLAVTLDESVAPVDANMTKVITIYRDYTYSAIGTGTLQSAFFEAEGEFEWEKADQTTWYKALSPYDDGYNIIFKIADDGKTVTVDKQAITGDISGYGTGYVEGKGELVNGVITVNLDFTVSAGGFGSSKEIFILPSVE